MPRRRRLRSGLGERDVHLLDRRLLDRPGDRALGLGAAGLGNRRGRGGRGRSRSGRRRPGGPQGILPRDALRRCRRRGRGPRGGRWRSGGARSAAVAGLHLGHLLAELRHLHLVHGRLALQLEDARLERLDLLLLGVVRAQGRSGAAGGGETERDEEEGEALHRVLLLPSIVDRLATAVLPGLRPPPGWRPWRARPAWGWA